MNQIKCNNCLTINPSHYKYCTGCGYELPKSVIEVRQNAIQEEVKKPFDKRKIIKLVVGVILFCAAYFSVQQIFKNKPSFNKVLIESANEINKTCPFMVDQVTRLDNVVVLPDNSFQYNYTLINLDKSEINLDTVKKYVEPVIINNAKTSPELKIYRDNKVTLVYYYRDKNGVFVHKFSVTPNMYN